MTELVLPTRPQITLGVMYGIVKFHFVVGNTIRIQTTGDKELLKGFSASTQNDAIVLTCPPEFQGQAPEMFTCDGPFAENLILDGKIVNRKRKIILDIYLPIGCKIVVEKVAGEIVIGKVAGDLWLMNHAHLPIQIGHVSGMAFVINKDLGDITLASVEKSCFFQNDSIGSITVLGGPTLLIDGRLNGVGDINHNGVCHSAYLQGTGVGDFNIAHVIGGAIKVNLSGNGGGSAHINGGMVGYIEVRLSGYGDMDFGGMAGDGILVTTSLSAIRVHHMLIKPEMEETMEGLITIDKIGPLGVSPYINVMPLLDSR